MQNGLLLGGKLKTTNKKNSRFSTSVYIYSSIIFYIIISILVNLSSKDIEVFDVPYAVVSNDINKNVIVYRQETPIVDKGNILFLKSNNSKVLSNEVLYLKTSSPDINSALISKLKALSKLDKSMLENIDSEYKNLIAYNKKDIEGLRNINENITNLFLSNIKDDNINTIVNGYASDVEKVNSQLTGIFTTTTDGYENKAIEDLAKIFISESENSENNIENIGKIITSENWSVIYEVSKEEFNNTSIYFDPDIDLKSTEKRAGRISSSLNIIMDSDKKHLYGSVKKHIIDGRYFIELEFQDGLIRYANLRRTTITISKPKNNGFRVPKTSIVKKGNLYGVYVLNTGLAKFKKIGIFIEDKEFPDFYLTYDGTDNQGNYYNNEIKIHDIIAVYGNSIAEGEKRYQ